jgi:hypothetical protein
MQQKSLIMEPNKFDYNIKEEMEARTIAPSAEAWEKLEAMMPLVEQPKRKVAWLYIAASFTGLLIVGTIFFQNFETNIVKKNIPLVLEQIENTDRSQELELVKEAAVISKKGISNNQSGIQVVAAKGFPFEKATNEKNRTSEPLVTNLVNEGQNASSSLSDKSNTTASGSLYISAAELLATVSSVKLQTTATERLIEVPQQGYKINPNSLLSNAETELNQTFRETTLNKLSKNFNSIKTVLVNRNYAE